MPFCVFLPASSTALQLFLFQFGLLLTLESGFTLEANALPIDPVRKALYS